MQALFAGPLGFQFVESVDYSLLQRKVLSVTSEILKKKVLVFEDKLIIDNALNLWVGCLLHRGDLLKEFVQPTDQQVKPDEFLLTGLLYCPYETVREEFKQSFGALCRQSRSETAIEQESPLDFVLGLLSKNFSLISEYPCKQYFELFCELLDKYFANINSGH